MSDILVSINCITYNHEDYIADAIEGFLMQETDFEYEILIHDDASTDGTADIVREYEKKYPDVIKPIYQTENQFSKEDVSRISYTFNHTRAKGKYIAMCEGDDYWTDPKKLQKQVNYMGEHSNVSLCYHAAERVTPKRKKLNKFLGLYGQGTKRLSPKEVLNNFYATASNIYRKELLDSPPEWFFWGPAGDFTTELVLLAKGDVYYIDDLMSNYRVNTPESLTDKLYSRSNKDVINLHKKLIEILDEFNKYSNYKYEEAVKTAINKRYFYIINLEDNLFIRLKKFQNLDKNWLSNYNLFQKIKLYSRIINPKLYKKLAELKNELRCKNV
jgi:glycosyltransferase involved in cell wall biosynthesis